MDGAAWWAAAHGVAGSRTRLSDFPFPFPFHELEKKMATHSSVLAWRIPGTGELNIFRGTHYSKVLNSPSPFSLQHSHSAFSNLTNSFSVVCVGQELGQSFPEMLRDVCSCV